MGRRRQILGGTAIEDRLQEGVPQVLAFLFPRYALSAHGTNQSTFVVLNNLRLCAGDGVSAGGGHQGVDGHRRQTLHRQAGTPPVPRPPLSVTV